MIGVGLDGNWEEGDWKTPKRLTKVEECMSERRKYTRGKSSGTSQAPDDVVRRAADAVRAEAPAPQRRVESLTPEEKARLIEAKRRRHKSQLEQKARAEAERIAQAERQRAEAAAQKDAQRRQAIEAARRAEAQAAQHAAKEQAAAQAKAKAQAAKAEADQRIAETRESEKRAAATKQAEAERAKQEAERLAAKETQRELARLQQEQKEAEKALLALQEQRKAAERARIEAEQELAQYQAAKATAAEPAQDKLEQARQELRRSAQAAPLVLTNPATDDTDEDDAEDTDISVQDRWNMLRSFPVDPKHLEKRRVITAARKDPAHTAFDVLRTRLLQGLRRKKWSRVAITSPSPNCGKTFTSVNLALSLARQENCRTALLDFDMRRPSLAKVLGVKDAGSLGEMLRGEVAADEHMRCLGQNNIDVGRNLTIGLNDKVENYASEILQDPKTKRVLDEMQADLGLDVILFDMPPALYHDDVMAARQLFDGVLLIVGGGVTKPKEVKDVERRLGEDTPLLGTILNFSEGAGITKYSY